MVSIIYNLHLLLLLLQLLLQVQAENGCSDQLIYKQEGNIAQAGMHVICAAPLASGGMFINGLLNGVTDLTNLEFQHDSGKIEQFIEYMHRIVGTSNNRPARKWKAFTTQGSPIFSLDSLLYHRVAIIHTNGLWIWPGVTKGFEQTTFEGVKLTTLSVSPLVLQAHKFLSMEECDLIQRLAEPHMENSKTSKMDKDVDKPDTTWRTSTQYFLPSNAHSKIVDIDYRVASLTNTRLEQQEFVQVLRYEKTQQYKHHNDYFDIELYQSDRGVLQMLNGGEMNRLITVFWYLNNVAKGGHTIFPLANGGGAHATDSGDCDIPTALKVQPIKGEVIIFYSLHSDGSLDRSSLHGGCPVIEGTKWSANKWIWTASKGLY